MRRRHPLLIVPVLLALLAAAPAEAARKANTGRSGSACRAETTPAPRVDGLDTTSLGRRLRGAYEIGAPTRWPEAQGEVRRAMMIVHGGGWFQVGPGMLAAERRAADAWRAAGWTTFNVSYRACGKSIYDVLRAYDAVRDHVGDDVPICVQGDSAGGQLALLLAAKRRDVDCVIAYAAPTNFATIARQGRRAAEDGTGPRALRSGARTIRGLARAAFGARRLERRSPVRHVRSIRAPVLLATPVDDPLIPRAQAREFARALRAARPGAEVKVVELAPGEEPFAHGTASPGALARLLTVVDGLVDGLGDGPLGGLLPFLAARGVARR